MNWLRCLRTLALRPAQDEGGRARIVRGRVPAFAGRIVRGRVPAFAGRIVRGRIPAFAGMTTFFLLMLALPAAAHTRSESFSTWRLDGSSLTGRFQVDAVRATQLIATPDEADALGGMLSRHLGETTKVTQGDATCPARVPQPLAAEPGRLRVELRFDCPAALAATPATLRIAAFRAVSPDHVHYAVIGERETLFTGARDTATIGGPAKAVPDGIAGFVRLGLSHVLSGADHLAFLLALALLAGTPWRAALAATGFTLGHSLTLGLTAAGWLHPDGRAVESLIGFTIVYAAWEALATRIGSSWRALAIGAAVTVALPFVAMALGRAPPPWPIYAGIALFVLCLARCGGSGGARWTPVLLAAAFGLVHGAGFAGALIELDLPRDRLLPALLGFNLGVEAAQLLALGILWIIALVAARLSERTREAGVAAACAALAVVGSFWFVARTLA